MSKKTKTSESTSVDELLAMQAKGMAVLAIRNGPIEDVHASGRISEAEMKEINKHAVNQLYRLLWLKRRRKSEYARLIDQGLLYTQNWDDPEEVKDTQNSRTAPL